MPDRLLKLHERSADGIEAQGLPNRNGAILGLRQRYRGGSPRVPSCRGPSDFGLRGTVSAIDVSSRTPATPSVSESRPFRRALPAPKLRVAAPSGPARYPNSVRSNSHAAKQRV